MRNLVKFVMVPLLFLSVVSSAFAKRDITEREVENMDSWQENFDINQKKPGKYNIVITAEDKGGNTAIGGPFNIYIDPDSDYPIAGITNPVDDMRVPGNLNIVGTCVDDDGVSKVILILDGDRENPQTASGREFWSYYLDTNKLDEGPHTIEVYGIDINGLSSESKPKKIAKVTWNLDRRQPVTQVTNYEPGELVSGKVNLKGTVYDGNGIKTLAYSLDGGENYTETKISKEKNGDKYLFDLPVDTRKFNDGPSVVWFKATDKMGSQSVYSFLYFIDNTPPDVKIVSPVEGEVCNGKFGIAGYAKDTIGLETLSWTFGETSGSFELIPGNPYWFTEVDTRNSTAKSCDFVITATDTVGNVVTKKLTIPLNQENDKPVVAIEYPAADELVCGDAGSMYIRGIVTDDDGPASISYNLDNDEVAVLEAQGVFYARLADDKDLAAGPHTVTITATDIHGVVGNPVTVTFVSKGKKPEFNEGTLESSVGSVPASYGVNVHPESNPVLKTVVSSASNVASVSYKIEWGQSGVKDGNVELKAPQKSVDVSIPLSDAPWGLVRVTVKAVDIYERETERKFVLNVADLTQISVKEPAVVFDDSRIDSDGNITNDKNHPVSGYFVGGKIKSATIVPETPFASLDFSGNLITLRAGNAEGHSAKVKVRVVTEQNLSYESRELQFHSDSPAPVVTLDTGDYFDIAVEGETPAPVAVSSEGEDAAPTEAKPVSSEEKKIHIAGKVSSTVDVQSVGYRIFSAKVMTQNLSYVTGTEPVQATQWGDFVELKLVRGAFEFDIPENEFANGLYVIEIIADNGKKAANSVFVRKMPVLTAVDAKGKTLSAKSPSVVWADGVDAYALGIYQGELDKTHERFARADMKSGDNALSFSVADPANPAKINASSKYTAKKAGGAKVFISKIGEYAYSSGMNVVLPFGAQKVAPVTATVAIESDFPVTDVSYVISGEKVPGGDEKQEGKATVVPVGEKLYEAQIPLNNLPSRITSIKVTAKAGSAEASYSGFVSVLRTREADLIDNAKKVYWIPQEDVVFDNTHDTFIVASGAKFAAYANVLGPVTASLAQNNPDLTVSVDENNGNYVYLVANKDGTYKNVSLKVRDSQGIEYTTTALNLLVDTNAPKVEILSPESQLWVKNETDLVVKATDENGIAKVEYSLNKGESWTEIAGKSNSDEYSAKLALSELQDGLVTLNVRVTDNSGKISFNQTAIQKDTTPPEVQVIVPAAEDVINGENTIAFIVKDNGLLAKAEYVPPKAEAPAPAPAAGRGRNRAAAPAPAPSPALPPVELTLAPMIVTNIGTADKQIDEKMSFRFADAVGNVTEVTKFDFVIDKQSDLPIAEVHLPAEDAVLTPNNPELEFSGVIFDDDGFKKDENGVVYAGPKVYYKFDDGEYQLNNQIGSSFAIKKNIFEFTDNEHSITVYAEDINGVKGPEFVRNFKISLEEPKTKDNVTVISPKQDETVKDTIVVNGVATDKNGIRAIYVSADNGNTWNEAIGDYAHEKTECAWTYEFDTRVIEDGTHVLFVKVVDWYGIEGLYSSLINIDNTKPVLNLTLPLDDSTSTGKLFFAGQTTDNIGLKTLYITIRSLEGKVVSQKLAKTDLVPDSIITQVIDISSLDDGFYNVELTGTDAAENITRVSRNIFLNKSAPVAKVDLLYPLNGEFVQGNFNIYGTAKSESKITALDLYVDGEKVSETELSESGYFKFRITPDEMVAGKHDIQVQARFETASPISSNKQYLTYNPYGPWISIDNFTYGDFAFDRPYIRGTSGYNIDPAEKEAVKAKGAKKELVDAYESKYVTKVEISFNNGRTFQQISKKKNWKFRVENEDIAEGYHFLLVRATMANGEVAVTRCIVQVDSTKPTIKLISPGAGGRYNQTLEFSGLTSDDVALKRVNLALRKGDKAAYEIPGFIQGLYLDASFWGASLYSFGAGLSFFDDNVKLQAQFGQFTQSQRNTFSMTDQRYGGNIFGMKLLANVYYMPFRYYFGPDWDWLSLNVSVGANFSHFSESGSGSDQILSALLCQLEFPRVTRDKKASMFRTFSMYTEGQFWFIPSDVASDSIKTLVPQISVGLRAYVF
ncbi:Ig-like domain-containing protein [Treponema zioleckii]|uniref:Ig-like domain-containing protein n=1 Tax=Treponema zioleckii TaxID=331680 RepID=UPI00168BF61E|nr:Ig-like domain-containing protein [Treponema zioleckii]